MAIKVSECILHCESIEALDLNRLQGVLEKYTFACIRGLVHPDQISKARAALEKNFDPQFPGHLPPGTAFLQYC